MIAKYDGECFSCGGKIYSGETEIKSITVDGHKRWEHADRDVCHDNLEVASERQYFDQIERAHEIRFGYDEGITVDDDNPYGEVLY